MLYEEQAALLKVRLRLRQLPCLQQAFQVGARLPHLVPEVEHAGLRCGSRFAGLGGLPRVALHHFAGQQFQRPVAQFLRGDVGHGLVHARELAAREPGASQRAEDEPVVHPLVTGDRQRAAERRVRRHLRGIRRHPADAGHDRGDVVVERFHFPFQFVLLRQADVGSEQAVVQADDVVPRRAHQHVAALLKREVHRRPAHRTEASDDAQVVGALRYRALQRLFHQRRQFRAAALQPFSLRLQRRYPGIRCSLCEDALYLPPLRVQLPAYTEELLRPLQPFLRVRPAEDAHGQVEPLIREVNYLPPQDVLLVRSGGPMQLLDGVAAPNARGDQEHGRQRPQAKRQVSCQYAHRSALSHLGAPAAVLPVLHCTFMA